MHEYGTTRKQGKVSVFFQCFATEENKILATDSMTLFDTIKAS